MSECCLMKAELKVGMREQEEKILNEPAAIYWLNKILFVILSGL